MPRARSNRGDLAFLNLSALLGGVDAPPVPLNEDDLDDVPFISAADLGLPGFPGLLGGDMEIVGFMPTTALGGNAVPMPSFPLPDFLPDLSSFPDGPAQPPDYPMHTTTDVPCILDPTAYPGIVTLVLGNADAKTRLALWSTNHALQERLNADYYAHAIKQCRGFEPSKGMFPQMFRGVPVFSNMEVFMYLSLHCRVLDLEASCDLPSVDLVLGTGRVRTLRAWNNTDLSSLTIPSTVVLKCNCIPSAKEADHWLSVFDLTPPGAAPATNRLVYNVAYAWADAIFASTMGITKLPKSVKELVIHFKHIPTPRPRYILCKANGAGSHTYIKAFTTTDPVPPTQADEHLDPIPFPTLTGGISLFTRIAKLYHPGLKLTLVGLDEFDAARDADAAGDEAWNDTSANLPWVFPIPPFTRPKSVSMADKFTDKVLKLVPKAKRAQAARRIHVLSSAEYFKDGKHSDEADWWANGEVPEC